LAQEPRRVIWAPSAFAELQLLPYPIREGFLNRIDLVERFPEMYQVETQGKWAGLRRIPYRSMILFYICWKQDQTINVEALVHARRIAVSLVRQPAGSGRYSTSTQLGDAANAA
jgi:hypothetical protein